MKEPEFMRLHHKYFPADICAQYNITKLVAPDNYVYIKIKRGMYGLKQAAMLPYEQLVLTLAPYGYYPCPSTTGLWKHATRHTKLCLCVNEFAIKYFTKADVDHLLNALRSHHNITTDCTGNNYCGLTFAWNYSDGYVDISMPQYITKALHCFKHKPPEKPQYAPHKWTAPIYGQKTQYATPVDCSKLLDPHDAKHIQFVVGSLLYYARAVDPTMLVALNEIGTSQSKPTATTVWLLIFEGISNLKHDFVTCIINMWYYFRIFT